ncbi:MAG: urea ABC transporter permease subunit UrtB [Endozoicomonas sp.]
MNWIPQSVRRLTLLAILCLPLLLPQAARALPAELGEQLLQGSWAEREVLARSLASNPDPLAISLSEHWLQGQLFMHKASRQLVTVEKVKRKYQTTVLNTGEDLGLLKKRELKKIPLNNGLRKAIRDTLALKDLQSPDMELRKIAITSLMQSNQPENLKLLQQTLKTEKNNELKKIIQQGIALYTLSNGDEQQKVTAIKLLASSNSSTIYNRLQSDRTTQKNPAVLAALNDAVKSIESRRKLYGAVENVFFGLSLGSVLLLSAIGLAITFGVMGVINMAHGEMIMLGAYTTYVVQSLLPEHIGASLFISLPLAFLVAGLTGVLIERLVIRHLYGRPLETLLATFGISLILQQAVRSIFSPLNQTVITPDWMSGSIVINEMLSLTVNRLVIIGFSLVVFLGLLFVLKYTRSGLTMRAVTQNRAMAGSMGIRTSHVDALTFGLGSGIAGIAGVALSQLTNVGPNLGQNYIIDSFMVVVFGGVGNLWGTFVAAMGLGVANKFIEPWAGAVVAKILVLVFIILFIQKRPRGLFALKGRAVES